MTIYRDHEWTVVFLQHGMTALIWASGRGHSEVVNHLLEAGANPDAADKVRDARECKGDFRVFITRGSVREVLEVLFTYF